MAHTTCRSFDLFRLVARGFDLEPPGSRAEVGRLLKDRLLKLARQNKIQPLLLIDEAHLLSGSFLEELRILTNFDGDARDELTVVLSGHLQLESTLRLAINEAFAQRVLLRIRLMGLDRDGLERYVLYRLEQAGRTAKLFLPDAMEAIFKASHGVPRVADRIAEHSMLLVCRQNRKEIDADIVTDAIEEVLL